MQLIVKIGLVIVKLMIQVQDVIIQEIVHQHYLLIHIKYVKIIIINVHGMVVLVDINYVLILI